MSELKQIDIDEMADLALVELDKAEQALDSSKENTILIAYSNYQHEIGMFYAYMEILKSANPARYVEVAEECHDRIIMIMDKAETLYRSLKEMCEQ